jgi:hypothetical protein
MRWRSWRANRAILRFVDFRFLDSEQAGLAAVGWFAGVTRSGQGRMGQAAGSLCAS